MLTHSLTGLLVRKASYDHYEETAAVATEHAETTLNVELLSTKMNLAGDRRRATRFTVYCCIYVRTLS